MRNKPLLIASVAAVIALPALAQQVRGAPAQPKPAPAL
jgi:hypothetical protein